MLLLVGLIGPLQSLARACCEAPAAPPSCCCPKAAADAAHDGDGDVLRRACCRMKGGVEAAAPVEVATPTADPVFAPPAPLPSLPTQLLSLTAALRHLPSDPRPPERPLWLSLRTLRC